MLAKILSLKLQHPFKLVLLVLIITAVSFPATAQLDRLLNRTTDKLSRELERMAIEKISDVIAQKAAEKLENEFDKWLMEAMAEDSAKYDRDSAYYALGSSYSAFLQGLNDTADLPDTYTFDLNILYEISDGKDKPENIRYYFSKEQPILAIQTAKSTTNWQLMVMDLGNDVTVMYEHDGDKKTAQALPNMMKLAGGLAKSQNTDLSEEFEFEINRLPKKEKVAGYKCEGWEGVGSEARFETWMTDALGLDWKDTFGSMMQYFATEQTYQQSWEGMEGMVLKSESYDTEKGKLVSSMIAQDISLKGFTVVNDEYTFGYQ